MRVCGAEPSSKVMSAGYRDLLMASTRGFIVIPRIIDSEVGKGRI